jgi:hypothetical protein
MAAEIQKRRDAGKDLAGVVFRTILIVLPADAESRVHINEEVRLQWAVTPRYPASMCKEPGAILSPEDFEDVDDARLPQVPRDAGFFLLIYERGSYHLVFDVTPCYPAIPAEIPLEEIRKQVMRELAQLLHHRLFSQCFEQAAAVREAMLKDGWWPALCLLPKPYLRMAAAYAANDRQGAATIAAEYMTPDRISAMMTEWWSVPEFAAQRDAIQQGVNCYARCEYVAAVRTLVPCIEGTVARRAKAAGQAPPKHRQMPDELRSLAPHLADTNLPRKTLDEFIVYLRDHFFQPFDWGDAHVDQADGRHAVAHGARVQEDQRGALQSILALDSLCRPLRAPRPRDVVAEPPRDPD